jgi:transcriptional repressor of dcmA and dcmR
MEKLLNIKEAAEFLNVTEMTVRRWTNSGKLRCFRVGGKRERRFKSQDLQAYIEGRAVSPKQRTVSLGIEGVSVPDGAHVTHLSLNARESVDVGASYLLDGFANDETVLLVAPEVSAEHILGVVRDRGGDVAGFRKKGKLVLSQGAAKPETMANFISQVAVKARGRFRLFGDMSWTQNAGWSLEALHELENITNASLGKGGKLYLCQYPLWQSSGRKVMMAIEAHDHTLFRGELKESPFFRGPFGV